MKKVLIPVLALLVFSMITTVMARAIQFPVSGSFLGSATVPGEVWITEDGILHVKGAEGVGPISGDLPGVMEFTLNAAVDLNTGVGSMHGKYVQSDDYGTFEGTWRTENWGVVYYEGLGVAQGTGAYEGMIQHVAFWGYNLYLGGYVGPDGVFFEYDGIILSPHGVPLPP